MKADLIRKYKWYILGLIIAWILMAVGLSFCAWDDNSIRSASILGGTANFATKPDIKYVIVSDVNSDDVADVGDVVTYGSYYQTAEAATKDPIRWIVVNKANNELTLLAESVLTFGNFWNRYYHNGSVWAWEDNNFTQYYQNYMVSTLSMWLNSDYGARHDQGVAFTADSSKLGMRGFMNEAFSTDQIKNINNRTISGIRGRAQGNADTGVFDYGSKAYKVWIPSWSEIYGTTVTPWGAIVDGSPSAQFEYFKGVSYGNANPKLVGKTTAFASTPSKSNYTTDKDTSNLSNANNTSDGGVAWWWLRSPSPAPAAYSGTLVVNATGSGSDLNTNYSACGVRPTICIPV